MKIDRKVFHFIDLNPGDVFDFDGALHMKIDKIEHNGTEYNAVMLANGAVFHFLGTVVVTPVYGTFVEEKA